VADNPPPEKMSSPARKRILIVSSTLHIGGAERVIATLAPHLDRERFDVAVCYLKETGTIGEELTRAGVEVIPIPGLRGRRDKLTAFKLRKLIQQRRIDVVHTHDTHGYLDASLCRLMVPRVRHVHTFHWGKYPDQYWRYAWIERLFWRVPDRLIAVGKEQAAGIRELHKIPASRLTVLWNGVDAPRPDVAPEIAAMVAGARRPVVASASTLIDQKGLPHLLDACALLKQRGVPFTLLLIGGGYLQKPLEEKARTLGLGDSVRFLGWVPAASARALPACDIFVQSSLWEAMSIVVLEAMSLAKPMVVTNVGENTHVVQEGVTGLIVRPADPAALADGLEKLIRDPALLARLGNAARTRHLQHFTVRHMVEGYEKIYAEV
jgi:glycosyltransferase involved in cell wall biosynthesis